MSSTPENPFPLLRRDVSLENGGTDLEGRPILIVVDPMRNAYYRMYWPQSAILQCWRKSSSAEQLRQWLMSDFGLTLSGDVADEVRDFLNQHQLIQPDANGWHGLYARSVGQKHGLASTLMHNYLFFRVPLFHPDAALRRVLPYLSFVFSPIFFILCAAALLSGSYFISRQWGTFAAMFVETETLPSLAIFGAVLLGLKAVHEFGHALTAVHCGSRVPSMGVAFMLGTPVFYTDTTDSWRLRDRRHRLAIVFAGVAAEMAVACFATLLWAFLPDGLGRQICFAVMTSSVVMTLLVNLNPCMRYDGYFALADYLDVANLQPRSFALATWKLRELLFGLGQPPPEEVPRKLGTILILYAWTTWIYRVLLFAAIAFLVYSIVFKFLGIALGLFEIVVFIALPVVREFKEWWQMRALIARRTRGKVAAAVAAGAVIMCFLPLDRTVEVPAVLSAAEEEPLHLQAPAVIQSVHVREGQSVARGDVLFRAFSPEISLKLSKARLEAQSIAIQQARLLVNDKDQEKRLVFDEQRRAAEERIAALERQAAGLVVRAPLSGTLVDLDPSIRPGLWQSPAAALARVVSFKSTRARGIVSDAALDRIAAGSGAKFIPEDAGAPSRDLTVSAIAPVSKDLLPEPILAEAYGGALATAEHNGEMVLSHGGFEVTLAGSAPPPRSISRGTVKITARGESAFTAVWHQVARVFVREQGF